MIPTARERFPQLFPGGLAELPQGEEAACDRLAPRPLLGQRLGGELPLRLTPEDVQKARLPFGAGKAGAGLVDRAPRRVDEDDMLEGAGQLRRPLEGGVVRDRQAGRGFADQARDLLAAAAVAGDRGGAAVEA